MIAQRDNLQPGWRGESYDLKEKIIDNLTKEQENILQEKHGEDYHGLDDDMPDDYEGWLENITSEELIKILKL